MQKIQMITIPLYKHDNMTRVQVAIGSGCRVLDLKSDGLGSMPPFTLTGALDGGPDFTCRS